MTDLFKLLPPEGGKILLVLFLSFLTGVEREERGTSTEHYSFGGVRTYPLIGLIGFSVSLVCGNQVFPVMLGLLAVAAFLVVAYWHKIQVSPRSGLTTEMSALTTYLAGALVERDQIWIATTLSVASVLLLELKSGLEGLTKRIEPDEVLTFTKFLLLTAVILPVLPNEQFGPFHINPFKAWLVVVAVCGVSYGSYVIQKLTKGQGGVILAALLGGAYSSTVTTVVMAKRAARESRPNLFAGGILMASSVMYLRLAGLVAIFDRDLAKLLGPPFLVLAAGGLAAGWAWTRIPDASSKEIAREHESKNPLELRAAFGFGALFMVMLIGTQLVSTYAGKAGVFTLAGVMGLADVDPFIMGMTQSAGKSATLSVAAVAILIAAASNNIAKGFYAFSLGGKKTGIRAAGLLIGLALCGLIPALWLAR